MKISLLHDTPRKRAEFQPPASPHPSRLRSEGAFPSYTLGDPCGCNFVKPDGSALVGIVEFVRAVLAVANVKRVDLMWYWDKAPTSDALREQKVDIEAFNSMNQSESLQRQIWYRISDPRHLVASAAKVSP